MNLLIEAAGLGTRLKPITNFIPKPVLPILNVPILFWNSIYFKNSKINNTVVNTFHKEDVLREHINRYSHHFIFSSDGSEVLGTGGAISNNKDVLITTDDFWVIHGDGFFLTNELDFITRAETLHRQAGAICTLVVCEHPGVGTQFGGVWVDSHGKVIQIGKKRPTRAAHGYHFTGFRILSKNIFEKFPQKGPHELFDTINELIEAGIRIEILKVDGEFFETGNLKDYLATQWACIEFLKQKKYTDIFDLTLKTLSPQSKLCDADFMMKFAEGTAPDAIFSDQRLRIFEGCQLAGNIITGSNITIRENCNLKNVVILSQTDVPENTHCQNTVLFQELF